MLTVADFVPLINERFSFAASQSEDLIEAFLSSVDDMTPPSGDSNRPGRPFSLLFRSEETRVLPQQLFSADNSALGTFEVFLVPIGSDSEGATYEAVFT